jgi:hypothetical protein
MTDKKKIATVDANDYGSAHTFQDQKEVIEGFREREELYDTGVVCSAHNLYLC